MMMIDSETGAGFMAKHSEYKRTEQPVSSHAWESFQQNQSQEIISDCRAVTYLPISDWYVQIYGYA